MALLHGFRSVQLFKDQNLGIGSYGKVCKAKCDELLCAAKLIHETLFDPTAQQLIAPERLPVRRFEAECDFLSTIKHPNIIQYLGIYRDQDTGLPAFLMELMDNSLTRFLESSTQPIPYHIQVNICHDITLALSFLHSNSIVHRDLSSNNVLLIGDVRAKVTDFGIASLCDQNPQATHLTFTMCPDTNLYIPSEAVKDKPVYTEKIESDCFSFGVIILQILTRQFPNPGDRRREIYINQPGIPAGTMAEIQVSETEHRQSHISIIDANHTLLQISLDCLKDRDVERPSAQQLCERVAALKGSPEYSESAKAVQERNTAEQSRVDERDRETRSLRQLHTQQVSDLEQVLREKDETIAAGQQQIRQQLDDIKKLQRQERQQQDENDRQEREKNQVIEEKERQLCRVNQRVEECERVIAQFQRRIAELQLKPATDTTPRRRQKSSARLKMRWWEGRQAPYKMSTIYNAVADGIGLYVRTRFREVHVFIVSTSSWHPLPDSVTSTCPSVIVNNLFTLIGGFCGSTVTNQLFSLTGVGIGTNWTEEFPPMPTKRWGSTALYTGTALIVAGGESEYHSTLHTVEVMNTETLQWFKAANLPQPLVCTQGAVCGDRVYILSLTDHSKSMYTCPVSSLIQSCWSRTTAEVWKKVAAPPVRRTTCVSIFGQLLTIGGWDSRSYYKTSAVHLYNPGTDSWKVISHMETPRWDCFVAVLPNNKLMVMGGMTGCDKTDSVELATFTVASVE